MGRPGGVRKLHPLRAASRQIAFAGLTYPPAESDPPPFTELSYDFPSVRRRTRSVIRCETSFARLRTSSPTVKVSVPSVELDRAGGIEFPLTGCMAAPHLPLSTSLQSIRCAGRPGP